MEDRKKLRWFYRAVEKNIYSKLYNLNHYFPYAAYISILAALLVGAYYFCMKLVGISWESSFLFFVPTLYILSFELSEHIFSFIDIFLISLGLYLSSIKKLVLFIFVVVAATLNRESGILLSFAWLAFNPQLITSLKILVFAALSLSIVNFDIADCLLEFNFYLPSSPQHGQYSFSTFNFSIQDIGSLLRVIFYNFLVFIVPGFMLYLKLGRERLIFLLLFLLYYIVFIFATPWHHLSVRLITIPFLVILGCGILGAEDRKSKIYQLK
jgi:hypothetical protein